MIEPVMTYPLFEEEAEKLLGQMSPEQKDRFRAMEALYADWNSKINVISRKDIGGLYRHHVLHSLAIAVYLKERQPEIYTQWQSGGAGIIDVGTGGGFPGLPLAIMFPRCRFTLCDSVGKKIIVADAVAKSLGLKNVVTVNARAESLERGAYDYVVSRAVASLVDFWPWVKDLFKERVLYLRGGNVEEECGALCARYGIKAGRITPWPVFASIGGEYFEEKWLIDIAK